MLSFRFILLERSWVASSIDGDEILENVRCGSLYLFIFLPIQKRSHTFFCYFSKDLFSCFSIFVCLFLFSFSPLLWVSELQDLVFLYLARFFFQEVSSVLEVSLSKNQMDFYLFQWRCLGQTNYPLKALRNFLFIVLLCVLIMHKILSLVQSINYHKN